jgi:hypothetical protein
MDEEWESDSNQAVENILAEYPEAREFASLISASTVDEFRSVASAIASKVRNIQSNGTNQPPSPSPRTPKTDKEKVTSVEEAISAKSWPDYLHAKWEAAGRA